MRIENANHETMRLIALTGKVVFWIFATSFAFALVKATIAIIKYNPAIY